MRNILLISLTLLSLHGYSQVVQSKIVYHCVTNLAQGPILDGRNTLHFNQEVGLFIHNDYPKENEYEDIGNTVRFVKGDPEGLPVFLNLKERHLYYKSNYGSANELFIFKEELPDIAWDIRQETRKIGNLLCTKAIGNFGGRTYEVWFTPEIPVSLGPYKLWGLPGLILEARSRDGKVVYEFQSFDPDPEEPVALKNPTQGKEISWEEFEQFIINKLLRAEAMSTAEVRITDNDPPADWTIERNKFTIISDYKRKRGDSGGEK